MAAGGAFRFPKESRLRKRTEFLKVQERGKKVTAGPLLGLVVQNGTGKTRLGITVSSKVGNAVVRVRIRRVLRELFRTQMAALPQGVDLVLIARQSAKDASSAVLKAAFLEVAKKL